MPDRTHHPPNLIYAAGSQVVTAHGVVAMVVAAPADLHHSYRVRFADGTEANLARKDVTLLAAFQEGALAEQHHAGLYERIIYRCVLGSRAYGLEDDASDTDYRGVFLPRAEDHWSLGGVPAQLERHDTQEHYWELQRFLELALKANPNVLECLYSPLVEHATPLARELLELRPLFLSKLVYQTFNGYVLSQFRKMQADMRNKGEAKPKHAMHLIRLLIAGIGILCDGDVPVRVTDHRERLLAIKRGEMPETEREAWRHELHAKFDRAFSATTLPDRPDYARADTFLIRARRLALEEVLP